MKRNEFFCFENEVKIPGLISPGTMGFYKEHPLIKSIIEDIKTKEVSFRKTGKYAWETVGPKILTEHVQKFRGKIEVLPSYYFLPSWKKESNYYSGHGKVYAHQEWGSTCKNGEMVSDYSLMQEKEIPKELLKPTEYFSVLICSYNTKKEYIVECLESIRNQVGYFGIELVWINDGSSEENSEILEKNLDNFINTCRFTKLKYKKLNENRGVAYSLKEGLKLTTCDLVFRMDSDDIMIKDRMKKQISYMKKNTDINWLGGSMKTTKGNIFEWKNMTLQDFKSNPTFWFCNHPTVCFRKKEIQELGDYDIMIGSSEDFDLELKILKKYGKIDNMKDILVIYRDHVDQVTKKHIPNRYEILKELIHKNIFK